MTRIIQAAALCGLLFGGAALAQTIPSYGSVPRDTAATAPLTEVPATVQTQSLADGDVTHAAQVQVPAGQAAVTVRSIQPNSVAGDYRIDFAALDADGDGFISRDEAQANPSLAAEFDSLDTRHSGKLDRAQLAGWLRD